MMEELDSIEELKIFAEDALGTPEQVNFQSLRRVLFGILGYLAFLTGEAFEADGVRVPANPQLSRRLDRSYPASSSTDSKAADRQRSPDSERIPSPSGSSDDEDDTTDKEKSESINKGRRRSKDEDKTDSVPAADEEEEYPRTPAEETGPGEQDGVQEADAQDKADRKEDKPSEKRQTKESRKLKKSQAQEKRSGKRSAEKDKDKDSVSEKEEADKKKPSARSEKEESDKKKPSAQSEKEESDKKKPSARSEKEESDKKKPSARSEKEESDKKKPSARSEKEESDKKRPPKSPHDSQQQDGAKEDARAGRRDVKRLSKDKLVTKPTTNAAKPKQGQQRKQSRGGQSLSTPSGGTSRRSSYETMTEQQQKQQQQQETDNLPGTSASLHEAPVEDVPPSTRSSNVRSERDSTTRVDVSSDDHPDSFSQDSQVLRSSSPQESSTRHSFSKTKVVHGSESDTDEDRDPLYASKAHFVHRQDLDDIVKRLELVEKNVSKMKSGASSATLGPASSGANPDAVLDLDIRAQSKVIDRKIEMAQMKLQDEIYEIRNMINVMKAQLQYLPNPPELHKTYYPTWKMLEDVLSPIPSLRQSLKDMRELVATTTDVATLTAKQSARFLGNPGPSDRLLNILEEVGRMLKQNQQISTLAEEVADMKTKMASKQLPKGARIETVNFKLQGAGQSTDDEYMIADTDDTVPEAPKQKAESQPFSNVDSGYLGFKVAKLGEDVFGLRKEMDELQLWKDKISFYGDELKMLQDSVQVLKRDQANKDERDHQNLTNIQMVLSEFQSELGQLENKKAVQQQRQEMDNWRATVRTSDTPLQKTTGGMAMDREARIRTQQLQMQVNTIHQMMLELQTRFPDQQFSPQPSALPEEMQYPWGTGRSGPSMVMRTGGGVCANPVSPPPPRAMSPIRIMNIMRPTPVGGAAEPQAPTSPRMEAELQDAHHRAVLDAYGGLPKDVSLETTKQMEEEKAKLQQTITRLNTYNQAMSAKLEACLNQQTSESRRLQDLMSRMHKETMNRYNEVQHQLEEFLNEEYDLLNEGHAVNPQEGENQTSQVPAAISPEGEHHAATGPRQSRQSATRSALLTLRKELMGLIKALRHRITNLEHGMPLLKEPEVENAAILKRPIYATFQCLSCDRRVDITKPMKWDGEKLTGIVPPGVPELPRLAPNCSPPRVRCTVKGPKVKPPDVYHIPRQCGGSYTSTNKPRRIYFYSNLGEALETAVQIPSVERVDMKGTDGQIYKGHLHSDMGTEKTRFSSPPRNRVEQMAH